MAPPRQRVPEGPAPDPAVQKLRVRYAKRGRLRFTSSRDFQRALERALRQAEPDGYIRLFADLGLPMARLLQAARSRGVLPAYIDRLLAAFVDLPAVGRQHALPEPLSARETEVLRLIAAGLTNQEIADSLVISAETVKKHTSSIYGKLGVRSRTEAAARGRALDLLGEHSDVE